MEDVARKAGEKRAEEAEDLDGRPPALVDVLAEAREPEDEGRARGRRRLVGRELLGDGVEQRFARRRQALDADVDILLAQPAHQRRDRPGAGGIEILDAGRVDDDRPRAGHPV